MFIDGYILSGTTGKNELAGIVKEGNTVSAVGLLYLHPEGDSEVSVAVLRVRDCDEIIVQESIPTGHRFEMREDQIICSVCGEQLMINLAQDYVALTVGESIELEVSPAEFAEHIEWILDGDEDIITMDGNVVTAVTPGSVYVNADVPAGEF